ncbi:MAG: BT4734/BF3469 family protein, partial [Candidatus Paceibacterota bacterium]
MSSIFDIKVSGYANYYSTEPKPVNLFKWLTSIKYAHKVQAIRSSTDKKKRNKLKAGLPAVIPSGTFEGGKEMEHFVRHSGFITIDIDGEDHKNLHNFGDLKCLLSNIPEIAYCGLSVSGNGYWGLVKIAYPERHKEHYFALENAFSRYGINLDAQCKNINRLRGYSFDPDTYFNEYAPIFYHLASEPVSTNKELQHQPKQILQNKPQLLDNRDKIETLIEKLE